MRQILSESCSVPLLITTTFSPFGKPTGQAVTSLRFFNQDKLLVTWLEAPISIIHHLSSISLFNEMLLFWVTKNCNQWLPFFCQKSRQHIFSILIYVCRSTVYMTWLRCHDKIAITKLIRYSLLLNHSISENIMFLRLCIYQPQYYNIMNM